MMAVELLAEPQCIAQGATGGEVRIPALGLIAGKVVCFYDQRPAPATGVGSDFTGEVMASDLPNPNKLMYQVLGEEMPAELLMTQPAISSDACVASDDSQFMIAYASVDKPVNYISSRHAGPRLVPWVAWGSTSLTRLSHRRLDELYDRTGADALFAASGSTLMRDGVAYVPYVMRTGRQMCVRIAQLRAGELLALSDPIAHPQFALDETTLAYDDEQGFILNARIQGFAGRGAGGRLIARSSDGMNFSTPEFYALPDPGCNAKALGTLFIHPHSRTERARGAIVDMASGDVVFDFGPGEFGYSDALQLDDRLIVVAERERGLWRWELKIS